MSKITNKPCKDCTGDKFQQPVKIRKSGVYKTYPKESLEVDSTSYDFKDINFDAELEKCIKDPHWASIRKRKPQADEPKPSSVPIDIEEGNKNLDNEQDEKYKGRAFGNVEIRQFLDKMDDLNKIIKECQINDSKKKAYVEQKLKENPYTDRRTFEKLYEIDQMLNASREAKEELNKERTFKPVDPNTPYSTSDSWKSVPQYIPDETIGSLVNNNCKGTLCLHANGDPNDDLFKEITGELHKIYLKKNHDYGNSFHNQYQEFGLVSAVIRLNDKLLRLKKLAKNETQLVNDESIEDTLKDLANYAILTLMELRYNK